MRNVAIAEVIIITLWLLEVMTYTTGDSISYSEDLLGVNSRLLTTGRQEKIKSARDLALDVDISHIDREGTYLQALKEKSFTPIIATVQKLVGMPRQLPEVWRRPGQRHLMQAELPTSDDTLCLTGTLETADLAKPKMKEAFLCLMALSAQDFSDMRTKDLRKCLKKQRIDIHDPDLSTLFQWGPIEECDDYVKMRQNNTLDEVAPLGWVVCVEEAASKNLMVYHSCLLPQDLTDRDNISLHMREYVEHYCPHYLDIEQFPKVTGKLRLEAHALNCDAHLRLFLEADDETYSNWMLRIIYILCCFGLCSNILALIALTEESYFQRCSINIHFCFLLVADSANLLLLFLGTFTGVHLEFLEYMPYWFCVMVTGGWFIPKLMANYSITMATAERFIAICFPIRAKTLLNRGRSFKACICLTVTMILLWVSLTMYNYHMTEDEKCFSTVDMQNIIQVYIVLSMLFGPPMILVLTFNICIMRSMRKSVMQFRCSDSDKTKACEKTSETWKTSVLLLTISVAFIIFSSVTLVVNGVYLGLQGHTSPMFNSLAMQATNLASALQSGTNLYFYLLGGSLFREAFKKRFKDILEKMKCPCNKPA